MNRRHFQEEEFPEHCDHCPQEFSPGVQYQRVQMVVDADNSVVGGVTASVEHSFELVFCLACAGRLNHWLHTPLQATPEDGAAPSELDDGALEDELEKELYILAEEPVEGSGPQREPRPFHTANCHCSECAPCKHHPGVDCSCYCQFGTCGPATCGQESAEAGKPRSSEADSTQPTALGEEADSRQPTADSQQQTAPDPDPEPQGPKPLLPLADPRPPTPSRVCLDPDQMLGAADQFPGSDYEEEKLL